MSSPRGVVSRLQQIGHVTVVECFKAFALHHALAEQKTPRFMHFWNIWIDSNDLVDN
jgi:hypothetical protein